MGKRIDRCLIGEKYTEEIKELNNLGIETIKLPENPYLDNEIRNHADVLVFNCGNKNLIIDNNIVGDIAPFLKGYNIIECTDIKSPYPNDVKLNAALFNNNIICNERYVSNDILIFAKKYGKQILSTKQGYTKCNMCILNDRAAITEDYKLAYLLKKYQSDVLLIKPGYVHLSNEHYGFIGGAGCMVSDNEIYFSGDISAHPQYSDIILFLNKYNISPIYNNNRCLNDFGGFISL